MIEGVDGIRKDEAMLCKSCGNPDCAALFFGYSQIRSGWYWSEVVCKACRLKYIAALASALMRRR